MKHKISAFLLMPVMAVALALPAAAAGPLDVLSYNPEYGLIGLLIGVVLALIICLVLKSRLKNVRKGTTAEHYVSGRLTLTQRSDRFTHRTTIRTKIQKNNK